MDQTATPPASLDQAFERKVRASTRSIVFEQIWLRLWLLFAVIGLFFLLSFAGVWPLLSQPVHIAVLSAFVLVALGAIGFAAWVKRPTREAVSNAIPVYPTARQPHTKTR
jgi:Domain of unknown function (DUF4175)